MARLVIHNEKITDKEAFIRICPFDALEIKEGFIHINSACKMCKLCIRKGPEGAAEIIEEQIKTIDKAAWKGIAVYVDHEDGDIHPVTLELIGKARELAVKINQPVYCIFIGAGIVDKARELLHYGVETVYVYDHKSFKHFRIDTYTSAFEDFIKNVKPTAILVGATNVGRQLAPRVAARFRTGLTADCTVLDICENTDLVQIRPAFGGNIMAEIQTPNARPQLSTVRYKVMNAPERNSEEKGRITVCDLSNVVLASDIEVIDVVAKAREKFIENADVLVVAGRGVKSQDDLYMIYELADLLGGEAACTRPLVEMGWFEAKKQIGLSGRTVRPKLVITCGVSGSVQFAAGMNNSEMIVAVNKDDKAPIFKISHYGIVGDLYEVLPRLIAKIKAEKGGRK
jgi:electron transfer flavoprotein alpha subunit